MGGIPNFHFHSPSTIITTMDKKFISQLCPFYILHGDMDATVPVSSSIKFAKHLKEIGATVTLHEYPNRILNIARIVLILQDTKDWATHMCYLI